MSDFGSGWFSSKRAKTSRSPVKKSAKTSKPRPRRSGIIALEPRMMYDAAAAATVGAAAHHHHHDGAADHAAIAAAEQGPHHHHGNSGQADVVAGVANQTPRTTNVQTPAAPPVSGQNHNAVIVAATRAPRSRRHPLPTRSSSSIPRCRTIRSSSPA